ALLFGELGEELTHKELVLLGEHGPIGRLLGFGRTLERLVTAARVLGNAGASGAVAVGVQRAVLERFVQRPPQMRFALKLAFQEDQSTVLIEVLEVLPRQAGAFAKPRGAPQLTL